MRWSRVFIFFSLFIFFHVATAAASAQQSVRRCQIVAWRATRLPVWPLEGAGCRVRARTVTAAVRRSRRRRTDDGVFVAVRARAAPRDIVLQVSSAGACAFRCLLWSRGTVSRRTRCRSVVVAFVFVVVVVARASRLFDPPPSVVFLVFARTVSVVFVFRPRHEHRHRSSIIFIILEVLLPNVSVAPTVARPMSAAVFRALDASRFAWLFVADFSRRPSQRACSRIIVVRRRRAGNEEPGPKQPNRACSSRGTTGRRGISMLGNRSWGTYSADGKNTSDTFPFYFPTPSETNSAFLVGGDGPERRRRSQFRCVPPRRRVRFCSRPTLFWRPAVRRETARYRRRAPVVECFWE